jgi:cytochrome bd-type quinol oxidase subunit 1
VRHKVLAWLLVLVSLLFPALAWAAEEFFFYRDVTFPLFGNRVIVWILSQLHLNFAAFILGAPIFIVICEWIGWRRRDPRYERLAKEVTKVTAVAYSLTALTGGFFVFLLIGLYPKVSTFLFTYFYAVWMALYPTLFILETLVLYTYWYSWDRLQARKGLHILIGVLLNLVGTLTMFLMNGITAFMNTPVKAYETATFWQRMNSFTWWPLNIHRFIANVTFGGFIAGLVAAYLYLAAKDEEDRAFYDWMGFVGNLIGLASFMLLAFPGYLYGYEIYQYDASLGIYLMSDRLSMFFEMQGILIGGLFLAGNYYIWLSMKRIQGAERFAGFIKAGFALILVCNAIWVTPRHWFATMIVEPGMLPAGMTEADLIARMELPPHLGFLALMPAKNMAAALTILVTLANYVLYRIALRRGEIRWGEIDPRAQYALIFLAFTAIWTMGLMGAVRSLMRKHYHIYLVMVDQTAEAYTPTLAFSSLLVTLISLAFFVALSFIIWLSLKVGKEHVTPAR